MNDEAENINIYDFQIVEETNRIPYIPWDNIKKVMPNDMYRRWQEVSKGSTSYLEGFYRHDLEKFLSLDKKRL